MYKLLDSVYQVSNHFYMFVNFCSVCHYIRKIIFNIICINNQNTIELMIILTVSITIALTAFFDDTDELIWDKNDVNVVVLDSL